jgi:hypothetical protein
VSLAREEVPITPKLAIIERIKGDIILNTREANISKNKRMAKEIKEDCEEAFDLIDKK